MKFSRSLTPALLVFGLLAACGPTRRGPPFVAEREITDPQLVLGQRTFDTYCQQCHPGGASGLGPAINNKPLPGWLIRYQVRNGIGVMPAFSSRQISGEELDATVEYLKYLRGLGS